MLQTADGSSHQLVTGQHVDCETAPGTRPARRRVRQPQDGVEDSHQRPLVALQSEASLKHPQRAEVPSALAAKMKDDARRTVEVVIKTVISSRPP
jgi:hypothetical protein